MDGNPIPIRNEHMLASLNLGWPVEKYPDMLDIVNLERARRDQVSE